jgi:hypothetical protein
MLLCRTGPCAAIRQNHGLHLSALLCSLTPDASAKICYALTTLRSTIVLPDFVRSCSADEGKPHLNPLQRRGLEIKQN